MTAIVNNNIKEQDDKLQSKTEFVKNAVGGAAVSTWFSIMDKLDNVSLATMNSFGDVAAVLTCGAMVLAIPQISKNAVFDVVKGREPHRSITNTGGMCIGWGAMLASANISSVDTAVGAGIAVAGTLVLARMYQKTR